MGRRFGPCHRAAARSWTSNSLLAALKPEHRGCLAKSWPSSQERVTVTSLCHSGAPSFTSNAGNPC